MLTNLKTLFNPGKTIADVPSVKEFDYLLKKERYQIIDVKLLNRKFRIADSLSFYYSFIEIFHKEIYKFPSKNNAPLIIDCGANYGTSILFFHKLYPQSKIIGIEADPYIFNILKHNIKNYEIQNIQLLNYALWNINTTIDFYSEKADGGRIENRFINDKDSIKVQTMKLSDLLNENIVDMLKIDIEGAELNVLEECQHKLKNVQNIFIEYHSFREQPQKLDLLLRILSENNFRYQIHTQFSSEKPFMKIKHQLNMDLQLNIFGYKSH